jgi:DNA (cytosine-5)-methyltransferase 1
MYTVNDFFSGCGGLSQGFKEAGFKIQVGIDKDETFLKTFSHNFQDSKTMHLDLGNDDDLDIIPKSDIIIAGPPCQGFSLTGPRNIDDSRNKLYLSVFKTLKLNNPKAFLVENVRGLKTMWEGMVFKEILKKFESAGYNVAESLLNSADYGVPQIRHRVFIVGIRKDLDKKFEFPKVEFEKKNYISCEEAIGNLPGLEDEKLANIQYSIKPITDYQKYIMDSNKLYNHEATLHKKFVKETIALVPEGGNYKNLPKGIGDSRKFNEAWTRYHSKKPSKTIDTGHRNHFHYKWNRVPTIRENARLQSFKDSFEFLGTKTSQNVQVGNAVPPLLAFKIAKQLKKYLK